ncbi:MAG: hypothetical protein ACJ74O_20635 [Frankiaceae bacterium]
MAGLNDAIAVLEGGSRDGESTTVAVAVTRIIAPSDAPGLVDVYEQTDELRRLPGNETPAIVFRFSAQEPAPERITAESMHMPTTR